MTISFSRRTLLHFSVISVRQVAGTVRIKCKQTVPMAAWSEAHTVFNCSNIGIVSSHPARGMDVCPRFSVLCRPA